MQLSLELELERQVYGDDEALRGAAIVHNGGSTPVYVVERRFHPHAEPGRLGLCACVHQVDALTCIYDYTPPDLIELAPGARRSWAVELPLATWRLQRAK